MNTEKIKADAQTKLVSLEDPRVLCEKIFLWGAEEVEFRKAELMRICKDPTHDKFIRFTGMIDAVFLYLEDEGMRLEMFQLELLRGFFLGIARNQFMEELFKYKHIFLDMLGLATPEIKVHNPMCPSKTTMYCIDAIFNKYGKPYTAALAPRQCGKTTIMTILLAAMVSYLDIEIVVQAQNKNMCGNIYDKMLSVTTRMQYSSWFPEKHRMTEMFGSTNETREFRYHPDYKGTTKVHFLSSSPLVSIFL